MTTLNLLYKDWCPINQYISVKIPSVREIIKNEDEYYSMATMLTSMPIDMMVQLDDNNIDFTAINEYDLFLLLFKSLQKKIHL